jgi:hypothetical protein
VHASFYSPREALTLRGAPIGGPGQQEPILWVIWRSSSPAPLYSSLDREVDVRIHSQDTAVCKLACTVTAVSVTQQCSRAATVGSEPSVRRRSSVDLPRRCLRAHCCSACLGTRVAGHHHARARRRDGIVRRLRTVYGDTTRRLGNRRAYRGVSLSALCVSGRPYF